MIRTKNRDLEGTIAVLRMKIENQAELIDHAWDAIKQAQGTAESNEDAICDIVKTMPGAQMIGFGQKDDSPWSHPERSHRFDGGIDLKANVAFGIDASGTGSVPTGTTVSVPKGYVGLLAIRSGLATRGVGLLNGVGVIDHGYTGEIRVLLANLGTERLEMKAGDRIAQLIVIPCVTGVASYTMLSGKKPAESERGSGGFGSTGD